MENRRTDSCVVSGVFGSGIVLSCLGDGVRVLVVYKDCKKKQTRFENGSFWDIQEDAIHRARIAQDSLKKHTGSNVNRII